MEESATEKWRRAQLVWLLRDAALDPVSREVAEKVLRQLEAEDGASIDHQGVGDQDNDGAALQGPQSG